MIPCDTGMIFNIQRFCMNDGPGLRTTLFMKGCPLHCQWCHNPESQLRRPEIFYHPDQCIGCLQCVPVCPENCHIGKGGAHLFDRASCIGCGRCASVCPGALESAGKEYTVSEVMEIIHREDVFRTASGGGVTFSGGEPLAQPGFLYSLLRSCRKGNIHTCVETCGWCDPDIFIEVASMVDLFLFDWKITDDSKHMEYTGVSNQLILSNLMRLERSSKPVVLRCPIIPGINDTKEHFSGIASLANDMNCILHIEIEPYHPFGISKAEQLGKMSKWQDRNFASGDEVQRWSCEIATLTDKEVLLA